MSFKESNHLPFYPNLLPLFHLLYILCTSMDSTTQKNSKMGSLWWLCAIVLIGHYIGMAGAQAPSAGPSQQPTPVAATAPTVASPAAVPLPPSVSPTTAPPTISPSSVPPLPASPLPSPPALAPTVASPAPTVLPPAVPPAVQAPVPAPATVPPVLAPSPSLEPPAPAPSKSKKKHKRRKHKKKLAPAPAPVLSPPAPLAPTVSEDASSPAPEALDLNGSTAIHDHRSMFRRFLIAIIAILVLTAL